MGFNSAFKGLIQFRGHGDSYGDIYGDRYCDSYGDSYGDSYELISEMNTF